MQEIPIDKEIERFRMHLENNPRVVLSAHFGDGKSYFLKKVKETLASECCFITIYPVNYSVAQNEDVFEYIKRDVLLQLANKQLLDKVDFTALADSIFSWENLREIISFLLSFVPGGSVYDNLLSKAEGFHMKYEEKKSTWKKYNDSFTMQRGGLYECDGYTKLIQETIKYIKESDAVVAPKRTVLIIEDLDRIDPKHLFRILNVLGAHIDDDKDTNKFGFDNIAVVMDYETTEHIFHHFYGKDANYSGYISKFMSCYPFRYSIKQIADDYLYDYIEQECRLPIEVIRSIHFKLSFDKGMHDFLKNKSVRDIVQILDGIENQYKDDTIDVNSNWKIKSTAAGIVKLLAIFVRMNISISRSDLFQSICAMRGLHGVNLLGDFMLVNPFPLGNSSFKYNNRTIRVEVIQGAFATCKFSEEESGNMADVGNSKALEKAFDTACKYVNDLSLK